MTFIVLFRSELTHVWRQFVVLAALSGLSNAAVLATINMAATADRNGLGRTMVLLLVSIVIYSIAQKGLMVLAATIAESTVNMMRTRFTRRLQAADLQDVERLDRGILFAAIGGEMQILSDGTLNLIIAGQALVLLFVTMFYLAFLSLTALLLAALFIAVAATFQIGRSRETARRLAEAFQLEARLLDGFTDFISGFKEVKLSSARSAELAGSLRHLSSEVAVMRLETRSLYAIDFVASQIAFFLLTGLMVFIVPMIGNVDRDTIVKITASSLFLIGPISTVVGALPVLQRVNSAAETIQAVEQQLSQLRQSADGEVQPPAMFHTLAMQAVSFQYERDGGEAGFTVGPIDLDIARGKVIFITGGNGSGKSTLLKLLTGLYTPSSGTILLDGEAVDDTKMGTYRELFAVIFSDNHLFRQLYGVPMIDPAEAEGLFEMLELQHKTSIVDRAFATVALSGGQRKRLAMIAALLEHRQICVFDEWAADQDPHFREKFYKVIIPELVRQGKTILAVTHDERYFDMADFRIHLAEGRLETPISAPVLAQ